MIRCVLPLLILLICLPSPAHTQQPVHPQTTTLLPHSKQQPVLWNYTFDDPGDDWFEPSFDDAEFGRLRRETEGELIDARDNDRSIARRWFRRRLFDGHPYGRSVSGWLRSVAAIEQADVQAQWKRILTQGNVAFGFAGDITADEANELAQHLASQLPRGDAGDNSVAEPSAVRGRNLLIVDKPSGLPIVPGGDFLEHTLLWMLRAGHGDAVAPLHRLGRGTSGLIAFAKSAAARRRVSADFARGRVGKTYRALVCGAPRTDRLTVTAPIGRVPYPPLGEVFAAVDTTAPEHKKSRSEVRVLERRAAAGTLVEVAIPTGRPHQIRIHLAAAGHPLVGEPLYAPGGQPRPPDRQRPALPGDGGYHLHSTRLSLRHPRIPDCVVALWSLPPAILRTRGERAEGPHSS